MKYNSTTKGINEILSKKREERILDGYRNEAIENIITVLTKERQYNCCKFDNEKGDYTDELYIYEEDKDSPYNQKLKVSFDIYTEVIENLIKMMK